MRIDILVVVTPAPIISVVTAPAGNVNDAGRRLIILLRRIIGLLLRVIDLLLWVVRLLGRAVIRPGIGLPGVVAYHRTQCGCGHSSIALSHLGAKQAACYGTQNSASIVCMCGKRSQSDGCGKRYGDQSILQFLSLFHKKSTIVRHGAGRFSSMHKIF